LIDNECQPRPQKDIDTKAEAEDDVWHQVPWPTFFVDVIVEGELVWYHEQKVRSGDQHEGRPDVVQPREWDNHELSGVLVAFSQVPLDTPSLLAKALHSHSTLYTLAAPLFAQSR